jgi:hypothetical protein
VIRHSSNLSRSGASDKPGAVHSDKLYEFYDTEIKTMEGGMRDLMFEKLANYEDDEAKRLASFLDGVLTPLVKEQYAILDRLESDIKVNTLNLDFYRAQFARISEIKQFVARTVVAGTS